MNDSLCMSNYMYLYIIHSDTAQCHTDLVTCCSDAKELSPGDWFTPSNTELTNIRRSNMYQDRQPQVVHLRRGNNANGPTGIYRCFIATNAVHIDSDKSVGETLYVGLLILWQWRYMILGSSRFSPT